MRKSAWQLQDAKNHFSEVVDAALQGRPQHVTRRGREAVVVLATSDFRRLTRAERGAAESFVAHLLAVPKGGGEFERMELAPRDVHL
ncbi:MAG: type II toxin-antitoxin system Phd/YefM family antitoxin [Rhodocyclaceae bacterium]